MTQVLIKMHDGDEYTTEVENYDAVAIMNMLNDTTKAQVAIGDVVVFRGSVNRVVKL